MVSLASLLLNICSIYYLEAPGTNNNFNNYTMGFEFNADAIKAAVAMLQQEKKQEQSKRQAKYGAISTKREARSTGLGTSPAKVESGAGYVIPAEFKQAIEGYLLGRGDMAAKMAREDKSIDKCCEYIYSMMLKRAKKMHQSGRRVVAMCPPDSEVFGYAVHYYDESDEELGKEK